MNSYLKTIFLTSFFIFCGLHAEQKAILGKHWLNQIQTEYQKGKFNPFLQEIHDAYIEEEIPGPDEIFNTPESIALLKKSLDSFVADQKIDIFRELREGRDYALMLIANSHPREFVSVLIKEILQKQNNESKIDDFKKLIYVFLIKKSETGYPITDFKETIKQFFNKYQIIKVGFAKQNKSNEEFDDIDFKDEKKYLIVLAMDLLQRVPHLTIPPEEKNELLFFLKNFINKQIEAHDLEYLHNLADGRIFPANQVEAEVAKVMRIYQENRKKLLKK